MYNIVCIVVISFQILLWEEIIMSKDKNDRKNKQLDTVKEFGTIEAIEGRHKIFCLNI